MRRNGKSASSEASHRPVPRRSRRNRSRASFRKAEGASRIRFRSAVATTTVMMTTMMRRPSRRIRRCRQVPAFVLDFRPFRTLTLFGLYVCRKRCFIASMRSGSTSSGGLRCVRFVQGVSGGCSLVTDFSPPRAALAIVRFGSVQPSSCGCTRHHPRYHHD